MAKVLFVSKDKGGAQMMIPLVIEIVKHGHDDMVISEGLASKLFEAEDFPLYFKGTVNFQEEPFTLDAEAVLKKQKPDVVVVSSGFPINLEYLFAKAANELGMPLVLLEDYWGGCKRFTSVRPCLVLTPDEYGAQMAEACFAMSMTRCDVKTVGHHELSAKELHPVNPSLLNDLLLPATGLRCLYVGGGNSTTAELELLLKCLKQTSEEWWLLPRFHPKWINVISPNGRTYSEVWNEILKPFQSRVIDTSVCKEPSNLVGFVDVVASGFSTLLNVAAFRGLITVSLFTEETMKSIREELELEEVPLVALGLAHSISVPTNISTLKPPDRGRVSQTLKPYDPSLAYDYLSNLL
ncbi:MAG: hypothetical protein Q8R36_04835 [bacterium]|nr:hypothetical protein [bacterium]